MAASNTFDVAVVGGGLSAFHAAQHVLKTSKTATVAHVHGFTFQEFPMGAAIFLNDPSKHEGFTSGDPAKWQVKNDRLTYFMSSVESIDCDQKEIKLMGKGPDAGGSFSYKTLIVATGSKSPLICPTAGQSLPERVAEVRACGAALNRARTVVFNGAGLVGLEMCGDFRAKIGYEARVILLSRSGKVLDTDFGDKAAVPDPKFVSHVTDVLALKYKIEIKHGSASGAEALQPKLEPGKLTLDSGEVLEYDVYVPCFAQGPNTGCLQSTKDGFLAETGAIQTNGCLQSTIHPEVFGVGVTTTKLFGHPISARVAAAATSCAANALLVLDGKEPKPHQDKADPPPMPHPMSVKIGHGKGAHLIWTGLPGFMKCCCCQPCGGFPCCPPPCCWCCLPGLSGACGTCFGPSEGEGPAIMMPALLTKFMPSHGYKAQGYFGMETAPEQQTM